MGLLLRFLVPELCLCCFILMEIFNKAPLIKPCQMNSRVVHLPPQRGWPFPPLPYPFLQTVPPSAPLVGEWTAPPPIQVPEPETPRAPAVPFTAHLLVSSPAGTFSTPMGLVPLRYTAIALIHQLFSCLPKPHPPYCYQRGGSF